MSQINYCCQKCSHKSFTSDEITSSGGLSKFFDIQNHKFTTITCTNCGFTDFYKKQSSTMENILDFITSN